MSADSETAANLSLTPEEKRVFAQLFRQADTDNVGVVTGEIAVKFFEKTRLDSRVLGEIWQIADKENRGFLTPAGFGIVLRLIGHCQAGREPTSELAMQSGPLPRFEGIPGPAAPIQTQGTGTGPIRIPPLTPEKAAQYSGLFERQSLQPGGLLPGEQAKQIFEKSNLPNEILGRIWQLADTEQRGALVQTEFVIAMHLLSSMKMGGLRALPNILPAALYEAATRRTPPLRQSPTGPSPVSAIPRQLSGNPQMRTGSPLGRPPLVNQAPSVPGGDWLVTPADKARFDQIYSDLDKAGKGYITGEEAVLFFSQSNLGEAVLAQIWDLADMNSEGQLNKDEFAVAMYLIRQQRTRRDGSSALPATLPPNLIPPSMRAQARPPQMASPFDAPPPAQQPMQVPHPPAPKSALEDLFGLDAAPSTAPAPMMPLATGGSTASDPFAQGAPTSPGKLSPTRTTSFKPFVPTSSFGRGLTHHATGDSAGQPRSPPPAELSAGDDLLGDNDPDVSAKLTSETTELANLSNQIGSLSKQMQQVQGQRTSTQNDLNQASAQKKNFEQRLSQLRTLYEKEAGDVRALEEQLKNARNETRKFQADCLSLEGTYQTLQEQHRQVLAGLQADQQENASLKEKIRAINAEISQLKPQIEKLKSEARQQKGLAAINKKQLSTTEGERDRLKTEVDDLVKSNEEMARQRNAGSPASAQAVSSPTPSTGSANNPFFKRSASTDIMGAFAAPTPKATFSDKTFDDVFGPSSAPFHGVANTPPPPVSFKPQNTGTSTGSTTSFATPPVASSPSLSRQVTLPVDPPPPVAESRQISSSFLPFVENAESVTSSRQVSPPLSRTGEHDTPGNSTIGIGVFPPIEAVQAGQGAAPTPSESKALAKPTPASLPPVEDSAPVASPAAVTENSGEAPVSKGAAEEADPFGAVDQAKAKADFENAFASFSRAHKAPEKASSDKLFSAFNTEFPPISELERDDESDSDSEQGGFDDDFAPSSPKHKKQDSQTKPVVASAATNGAANGESPFSTMAPIGGVALTNDKSDKPTSPSPFPEASPEKVEDNPFAPAPATAPTIPPAVSAASPPPPSTQPVEVAAPPPAPPKAPFDDLDDEFEGLEDAKEGSADDDFANISRSALDDFSAVFDSSPPTSQAKSEPFGAESSFDFGNLSTNHSQQIGMAVTTAAPTAVPAAISPPDSTDWDSLFTTLDPPTESAKAPAADNHVAPAATATGEDRPGIPGRSLTEEGKHDDPHLKNLTSMGYSRAAALAALEKFNYNLEMAADYLANQS